MTQTFLTTGDTNDLYLDSSGNLPLASGVRAVAAACRSAVRAMLGEMVLAQNAGMPNFQVIWVGVPNYSIFAAYLRQTLDSVEGVQEVTDINITKTGNVLNYSATIVTIYGPTTIDLTPVDSTPPKPNIVKWGTPGLKWGDFKWGQKQ